MRLLPTPPAFNPSRFVGLSGSPLARGLVYASGADFLINQANTGNGSRVGGNVITTPLGQALRLNGTSEYVRLGTSISGVDLFADSTRKWSVVVLVQQKTAGSVGSIVSKSSATTSLATLNILFASSSVTVHLRGSINGLIVDSTAPTWITVTWDGTTAAWYVNASSGALSVGTAALESSEPILFGARGNGASALLSGDIGYVLIYNREISREEHLAIQKNPGIVFAPQPRRLWLPSASSGASAALSGNASTSAQGSVTPSISLAIAGNGTTASAGTVSVGLTPGTTLSGSSATSAAGNVSPALSLALSGNGPTASAGAVAAGLTSAVSGNASSSSAGNVTPAIALAISGSSASASSGIVEVAGVFGAVLTGNAAASSVGALTPSVSVAVAGASATASQGAVGKEIGKSITGNPAASAVGSISPSLSIAISGNAATATQGTVVPSGPIVVGLTGNGAVASAGILAVFGTIPFLPQTGIDTIVESYTKDLVYQAVTKPRVFIARHHR